MIVNGVELIEAGDMVCLSARNNGEFEPDSVAAWKAACRVGMIALDVGAYSGLYSIIAAKTGAIAEAWEPNSILAARIAENAALNGVAVRVQNFAAGECAGNAVLVKKFSTSSAGKVKTHGTGQSIEVRVIERTLPVCAVKIDVEGYEMPVLKGIKPILEQDRPLVITEALNEDQQRLQVEYMEALGYRGQNVDSRNILFRCEL